MNIRVINIRNAFDVSYKANTIKEVSDIINTKYGIPLDERNRTESFLLGLEDSKETVLRERKFDNHIRVTKRVVGEVITFVMGTETPNGIIISLPVNNIH